MVKFVKILQVTAVHFIQNKNAPKLQVLMQKFIRIQREKFFKTKSESENILYSSKMNNSSDRKSI